MRVQKGSSKLRPRRRTVLGRLLGSEGRAKVLEALLLGTPGRFYVRELARRLDLAGTAVSRELAALAQLGLAVRERDGRRVYYQANGRAAVTADLRAVILKLGSVVEAMRQALDRHGDSIRWAFVHGSLAAGTATADSDVDLVVVGEVAPSEVHELLRPVGQALGREINPFVLTPREFREKRRVKNHFLDRVLSGPMIDLIGDARRAEAAH
jgi:DNA-binding transcriptional ArsR family regulator